MAEDFARADAESGRVEAVDEAGLARLVGEEGRWDYLVNTLPGSVGYRLPPSCEALLRQHTPVVRSLSAVAQESLQGCVVVGEGAVCVYVLVCRCWRRRISHAGRSWCSRHWRPAVPSWSAAPPPAAPLPLRPAPVD